MTINRLSISLFALRISVFAVMLMWTLDKFINPAHASAVYQKFYGIKAEGILMTALAVAELILVIAFVFGIKRNISYGLVLTLHGVSTLSSWPQYLSPFAGANLLFFAAWPMLAACLVLYLYRNDDQLFTTNKLR